MKVDELSPEDINKIVRAVVKRVMKTSEPAAQTVLRDSGCQASSETCSGCGACATLRPEDSQKLVSLGACRLGFQGNSCSVCHDLAPFIDHTLLRPNARDEDVVKLCKEALEHDFAAVVVNPAFVELAAGLLKGSRVKVCTVIGFPLGSATSQAKAFETRDAIMKGADEIDMVMNIGKLKSGDYKYVLDDIHAVIDAAQGRVVKVIIEAALLTDDEKIVTCVLAKAAGADFVKTSTGFGPGGATARDVAIMRSIVGPTMGVKAAGGIKDCETAVEMMKAGATRIGASAGVAIIKGEGVKASAQ